MTKQNLISCQVILHPYCDDYKEVIKRVLTDFQPVPLKVETSKMSSTLIGPEDLVWQKIRELYELARSEKSPFRLELSISTGCV